MTRRDRDALDQRERCRPGMNHRAGLAHRSDEPDEAIKPNAMLAASDEVTIQPALGVVPRGQVSRAFRGTLGTASSRPA